MRWLMALLASLPAAAGVLFEDGFEQLDAARWTQDIRGAGAGAIAIVDGGVRGKCLEIRSAGQHVYLNCALDARKLRGQTVVATGMVKLANVVQGPRNVSTAKFHFGLKRGGSDEVIHSADRWTGTFDWTPKRLEVQVPADCTELVFDIGNQNGSGVFWVDDLRLEDSRGATPAISLLAVCNTGRSDGVADDGRGSFIDTGALDLIGLPEGPLVAGEWSFTLPKPGDNAGRTLLALRGERRPNLPARSAAVPVGQPVAALALLGASAWAEPGAPVLRVRVLYADGQAGEWLLVAGRDLQNFDAPRPAPGWKPAWTGPCGAGVTVGVGVAEWTNPRPEVAIESLTFEAAGAGVPLILALAARAPDG